MHGFDFKVLGSELRRLALITLGISQTGTTLCSLEQKGDDQTIMDALGRLRA